MVDSPSLCLLTLRLFKKLYALQDRSILSSQPFRFESILQRRLRRFVASRVFRGEAYHHERMVEEKGRTFLHRTLLFQRSFSPEEEGLDRVIYSGKKPRSISPSLSYSRWIKRPVSRERHFAIIKKRREISLKNNLCSVPSSNEPQFRGKNAT